MANPQTENGYTRVANELLEAICRIRIPGEAHQVFNTIIRKTYGYGKTEDAIALSQLCDLTGLRKSTVCKAINKLISMNLITKRDDSTANIYSINKNFDTWKPLPKKVTTEVLPKKEISVTQKGNASLPKKGHTKENTTKETITKERALAPLKNSSITPQQEADNFFDLNQEGVDEFITRLASQYGWPRGPTAEEVTKFRNYWMERDKSGRKQRWQDEKHFELKRRFATWFSRAKGNFKGGDVSSKYQVGKA